MNKYFLSILLTVFHISIFAQWNPSGGNPTVIPIEVKCDSLYASYQHFSVWVRPLPTITGIEEKINPDRELAPGFIFYPNPVKNKATIRYTQNEPQDVHFSLYDLSGNKIKLV